MFNRKETDFNFTNTDFMDYLWNMSDPDMWFNERQAIWNSRIDPPFSKLMTKQGPAFTFNIIEADELFDFSEVSEDMRYNLNGTPLGMPWKTSADDKSGLQIILKRNLKRHKEKRKCHSNNFIIHDPFEQPMATDGLIFGYGTSLNVWISVDVIKSDEHLRDIDVRKRNCYFKDERKLKFFKAYTKLNCERECRSLLTFESCGCVPFYLVRNRTMKICSVAGTDCARHFEILDHANITESEDMCNCLPACDSITYNYDIESSRYNSNFEDG